MPIAQYYRARTGQEGDIIFEKRSWNYWPLPNSWHAGWRPYANAASARNKHSLELNKLVSKVRDVLHLWAQAEKDLQGDARVLREEYQIDGMGIGKKLAYLKGKQVEAMRPFTAEPVPEWGLFISLREIKDALKAARLKNPDKVLENLAKLSKKPDLMITDTKGRDSIDGSEASEFIHYKAGEKKSGGQGAGNKSKKAVNGLKNTFKRKEGESDQEWTIRLEGILESNQ